MKTNKNKPYEVKYEYGEQFSYMQVPEAGKTTATLKKTTDSFLSVAQKIMDKINPKFLEIEGLAYDFILPYQYQAVAKVHSECGDVFDAETGKRVAREKVLHKFHRDLDAKLHEFLYEARSLVVAIEHYMDKHNISYNDVANESTIRESRFKGSR